MNKIIEGGYVRDILDQPDALRRTVEGFREDAGLLEAGKRMRQGAFKNVVLTGMGGSFHAFHPLRIELAEAGIPATLLETSELIYYYANLLTSDTLLIILSQSGRSAETLRLLELNAGRALVVAVTNDSDSPLAKAANGCITTHAGPEHSVSSKTYLASLVALAWLSDHLCGKDLGRTKADLALVAPAVGSYLAHWRDYAQQAQTEIQGVQRIYYVGRGPSLATATAAGLVTKESAHFAAEGMSTAAFRHGPMELVDGRVFLLAMEGDPRTSELNTRLADDVQTAGGRAIVVRESTQPALFHTPPVPLRFRTVVELLPVQMITLALAAIDGREAGAFQLITKITTSE